MIPEKIKHAKATQISVEAEMAEIRRRAIPSWETVDGMLRLRTENNRAHHRLYEMYRVELREYYQQVYDRATGLQNESSSVLPRAGLAYHFRVVRETIFGRPEKFSKGYKRAIRRNKSLEKRTPDSA